jgi:hypothetical protein
MQPDKKRLDGQFLKFGISRQIRPLPTKLKNAAEHLSGYDMSDVRVHYNSPLPNYFQARAYAYGADIYLGPNSEDTLPHEAWHVVQQKQGRVQVAHLVNSFFLNDQLELEQEAQRVGEELKKLSTLVDSTNLHFCKPSTKCMKLQPIIQCMGFSPSTDRVQLRNTHGQDAILVGTLNNSGTYYATSANELRQTANQYWNLNSGNTPHFQDVTNEIYNNRNDRAFGKIFFLNETLITDEIKNRSFGHEHAQAMEDIAESNTDSLDQIVEDIRNDKRYGMKSFTKFELQNLNAFEIRKRLIGKIDSYCKSRNKTKNFQHWVGPFWWHELETNSAFQLKEFFQFLCERKDVPNTMNCWQCVLYGGYIGGLFGLDYIVWADITAEATSYVGTRGYACNYVMQIANHYLIYTTSDASKPASDRRNYALVPAHVPRGMIVCFDQGGHVAISTGKRAPINERSIQNLFGNWGHGIVELDGDTGTVRESTIEDSFTSTVYRSRLYFGWLPDSPGLTNRVQIRKFSTTRSKFQKPKLTNSLIMNRQVPAVNLHT